MRLAVIILAVLLLFGCSDGAPTDIEKCGTEEERPPNDRNAKARECLWQAYSADRITVRRDNTRDKFSAEADRKVTVATCKQMEREPGVFRFSGCQGDSNTVIRL